MARFPDLSTELIVAIASHLPRSADKLPLVLVNHQVYHVILPELYKHIMLDQRGDASTKGDSTRTPEEICRDVVRLRHMTSVPKDTPLRKSVLQSLSLELDSDIMHNFLSDAILDVPGLKHLNLRSKRLAGNQRARELLKMFIYFIRQGLRCVKDTLESLTINTDQDIKFHSGRGIGPLKHLTALKHLSVQSHILLNECVDQLCTSGTDGYFLNMGRTILSSSLPPRLQELRISGGMDGEEKGEHNWGHVTAVLLEDLMEGELDTLPELQHITVYYPTHYEGFPLTLQNESCKSVCSKYAAKGLWPEVAARLTELASQEHRTISVRYEPGSANGCRP